MSPSESRLLSHVSDTASTCILWEYMKFDNSAAVILLRIERALKVHMFSNFMFANDLGLHDISFDLDDLGRRLIDPTSTIGLVFQSEQSQNSMHEHRLRLHVSRYPDYLDIRMSEIRISSGRLHVSDRNVFGVYTCPDIRPDALYAAY